MTVAIVGFGVVGTLVVRVVLNVVVVVVDSVVVGSIFATVVEVVKVTGLVVEVSDFPLDISFN